jgi:hypothetical protein
VQQVDAAKASHLPAFLLPYLGLGMLGLLIVGLRPPRALYLLRPSETGSASMSCSTRDRPLARAIVLEDLVIGCPRSR